MGKEVPDHHDATLLLRVYELRREEVMRASRHAINREFWPKTADDVMALTKPDHPLNAALRQTGTYWEMVYNMVRYGIVHPDFFMEGNGEGLLLFAKVAPHLERVRQEQPLAFRNAEWVSKETAAGRKLLEIFTARVKKALESR